MSQEQEDIVWMIKGMIADLPEDHQRTVKELYNKIKIIMAECGEDAVIAVALLGAELAAEK